MVILAVIPFFLQWREISVLLVQWKFFFRGEVKVGRKRHLIFMTEEQSNESNEVSKKYS
jgi:hypothetical protein